MKLTNSEYDYIVNIIDDEKLKSEVVKSNNNINEELELSIYSCIEDKQLEIGFDDSYNLTEDGEKLQKLIDKMSD